MTAQTLAKTIDPEYIEPVNDLLRFLVDHADPDYRAVMEATLNDNELESNLRKLDEKLEEWDLDSPVGAIPAGTGITKDEAGFEGEAGQELIRILKAAGRLQQCGKGRGKCLLVLSGEPFERPAPRPARSDDTPREASSANDDDAPDNPGDVASEHEIRSMLRTIDASMGQILRERDELRHESRVKSVRIEELEAACASYEEQVASLHRDLEQRFASTWH